MWSGRLVPNKSVGQAHHTNRNEIKRTMAGKTQHQKYQNIRTSMEHMILIVCQLHHWVRRPNIHPPPTEEHCGKPTPSVGGTLELPPRTIANKMYREENMFQKSIRQSLLQEQVHKKSNSYT